MCFSTCINLTKYIKRGLNSGGVICSADAFTPPTLIKPTKARETGRDHCRLMGHEMRYVILAHDFANKPDEQSDVTR